MTRVQKAVFPGMVIGCVVLVFFASLAASPRVAQASNPLPAETPAAVESSAAVSEAVVEESIPADQPAPANLPASADQAEVEDQPAALSSGCPVSTGYPESIRQWCDYIDKYARMNNLDPNLVAAVMLQESGGNAQAFSKSGAVGLMQVMPRDGPAAKFNCINGPCFASRPSSQELYDPEFNIAYGTEMLAGLIQRTGNVRDALRSYGPMDVGYYYADIVLGIFNRY